MEGRYEDALAAWTEAYALSQRPLILFNMANAYERNGQLEKAVAVLNRYRAYAQPDEQEVILRRIKNMEQRLAQAQPQPIEQSRVSTPTAPFPTLEVMLMGSGAVTLVSGVLLASGAKNQGNQAAQYCGGPGMPCTQGAVEFLGKEKRYAMGADVCFVVGGLTTVAGLGLLLLPKGSKASSTARVQLTPTTSGMVMHGTF